MDETRRAAESVFREESGRIIASLIRISGSFDRAEEAMQEAFASALASWSQRGLPQNPAAWITAVAQRKLVDQIRRERTRREKQDPLQYETPTVHHPEADLLFDAENMNYPDDRLRLIFTCCHPALNQDAQVALTLRTLGGLTTPEIARAFLVPEPTLAQRLVRAKNKIQSAHIPYEVPPLEHVSERLESVQAVIYLIFNEGYTATAGSDWMRPALCEEALRLGRILAELMPEQPKVHRLVALMEIQASRLGARTSESGEPILLLDQDRTRWDRLLIQRGLAALDRAEALGAARGPYTAQAAIAACHARARTAEETDWQRIAELYEALARVTPSPVVELNRAVAIAMADGPGAGLDLIDRIASEPALKSYHLLPSVRGDFLFKLGRFAEAQAEFQRAATLTQNTRERELLLERAQKCAASKGEVV